MHPLTHHEYNFLLFFYRHSIAFSRLPCFLLHHLLYLRNLHYDSQFCTNKYIRGTTFLRHFHHRICLQFYEGSLSERQVIFSEDVMLLFLFSCILFHSSSLFSFWYFHTFTSCFHFHSCLHLKFIRWSPLFFSTSLKITWLSSYFSSLEYRWREACLCLWSPVLYGVKIVFRVPVSLPRCQISFETSEEWLINIHNDWNKLTFIQNKAIGNC